MADAENSSDLTVAQAANRIAELGSTEEILAFVGSDERPGIVKAADNRLSELASSGGVTTSDPRAREGTPLQSGGSGQKLVRTRFPIDRFEHGIDGVPVITAKGVEVDASKIDELLKVALEHDTALEEVEA